MKTVSNYLLMCIVAIAMFVGYGCSQDGVLDNHWNQERQMSESEKYVKQVHYDTYLSIDRDKIVYNELTDEEKVIIRNAFARLTLKTSDDGQTTIIEKSGEDVNISEPIYNYIKLSLETGNNLIRRLNGKISGHNALSVASVKSRSLDYNGEENDYLDSIKRQNDCVPLALECIAAEICNGVSPWTSDAIFKWIVDKKYGSYETGVTPKSIDNIVDYFFETTTLPSTWQVTTYQGSGEILLILKSSNGGGHAVRYLRVDSPFYITYYDPQLARNQNMNNNNNNTCEGAVYSSSVYKAYLITAVKSCTLQ